MNKDGVKNANECTRVATQSVNVVNGHEYLAALTGKYGALAVRVYDDTPHVFDNIHDRRQRHRHEPSGADLQLVEHARQRGRLPRAARHESLRDAGQGDARAGRRVQRPRRLGRLRSDDYAGREPERADLHVRRRHSLAADARRLRYCSTARATRPPTFASRGSAIRAATCSIGISRRCCAPRTCRRPSAPSTSTRKRTTRTRSFAGARAEPRDAVRRRSTRRWLTLLELDVTPTGNVGVLLKRDELTFHEGRAQHVLHGAGVGGRVQRPDGDGHRPPARAVRAAARRSTVSAPASTSTSSRTATTC